MNLKFQTVVTGPVVPSFSLPAGVDSSFLAEALDAALAEPEALVQALAWLPVVEEAAPAYFEVAALVAAAVVAVLAADALVAEPVAGAAATELVAAAAVAVLAVDARAAELVADAAAAELGPACSALAAVLAVGAPVAELVAGAAAAELEPACSDLVAALAAGAPVAELVSGAAAAELEPACSELVAALAADELAAALPVWQQAERRAVDCDWAEHFAVLRLADERRWAVVAARRWAVGPLAPGAELERGGLELPQRWVCPARLAGLRRRRRACRD